MKKLVLAVSVVLAIAFGLFMVPNADGELTIGERDKVSTPYYFSLMTNVTGASFTWQSPTSLKNSFRLGSFRLNLPANSTNAVSLTYVRRYDERNLYIGNVVETNGFGVVETNYNNSITGTVVSVTTNAFYTDTVTNDTASVLTAAYSDYEDYPRNHYFLPGDIIIFSWTSTGSVPLFVDGLR